MPLVKQYRFNSLKREQLQTTFGLIIHFKTYTIYLKTIKNYVMMMNQVLGDVTPH
jgi:hypothetical protein